MKKITTILLCAFGFFQLHSQTDSSMKTSTGENPANPVVERKKAPYLATGIILYEAMKQRMVSKNKS